MNTLHKVKYQPNFREMTRNKESLQSMIDSPVQYIVGFPIPYCSKVLASKGSNDQL